MWIAPPRHGAAVVIVAAVIIAAASPLRAQEGLLQPNGRINDFAGVLDEPTRAELAALSAAVDAETTAEIAAATVTSLSGMSVEEYAVKLFAAWGIGKRDKDNGVLVLVAPTEREMRIEVGYGLEPILPDGLAGVIVRDQFLPHFREGNFQDGIVAGVQRIAGIVRRNQPPTEEERRTDESGGGILGLIAGLVVLSIPATLVGGGGYFLGIGLGARIVAYLMMGLVIGTLSLFFAVQTSLALPLVLGVFALYGVFGWRRVPPRTTSGGTRTMAGRHRAIGLLDWIPWGQRLRQQRPLVGFVGFEFRRRPIGRRRRIGPMVILGRE